jgi:hypothetical protein
MSRACTRLLGKITEFEIRSLVSEWEIQPTLAVICFMYVYDQLSIFMLLVSDRESRDRLRAAVGRKQFDMMMLEPPAGDTDGPFQLGPSNQTNTEHQIGIAVPSRRLQKFSYLVKNSPRVNNKYPSLHG